MTACRCFPSIRGSSSHRKVASNQRGCVDHRVGPTFTNSVRAEMSREFSANSGSVFETFTVVEETDTASSSGTVTASLLQEAKRKIELTEQLIRDEDDQFIANGHAGAVNLWYRPKLTPADQITAKGYVFIPGIEDLGFALGCISSPRLRSKWDSDVIDIVPVKAFLDLPRTPGVVQERLEQVYNTFGGRFGLPGRDFVWNVYMCQFEHVAYHVTYSVDERDCPEELHAGTNGKFVRGFTYIGGYKMVRVQGGVEIHFVNQTDIGGSFPEWVSHAVIKKSPEKLRALAKCISAQWNLQSSS